MFPTPPVHLSEIYVDTFVTVCTGSICVGAIVIILIAYYLGQKKKKSASSRPSSLWSTPTSAERRRPARAAPRPPPRAPEGGGESYITVKLPETIFKEEREKKAAAEHSPSLKYAANRARESLEMEITPEEVEFKPVKLPRGVRRGLTPPSIPSPASPPKGAPPIPKPARPAEPIPPWGGVPRAP